MRRTRLRQPGNRLFLVFRRHGFQCAQSTARPTETTAHPRQYGRGRSWGHRPTPEAIRYGERPEVKARLLRAVDDAVDRKHVHDLIAEHAPVQDRYERVCFEKERINQPPIAAYVCPGHPCSTRRWTWVLERHRALLKRGAVLVDETDDGAAPRALFYLEHAVQDGRVGRNGRQQAVSQRLQFVEIDASGRTRDAGPAPYLDYRNAELDAHLDAETADGKTNRHNGRSQKTVLTGTS